MISLMRWEKCYLSILLFFCVGNYLSAQKKNIPAKHLIPSFNFYDVAARKNVVVNNTTGLSLFVFISPECPLCQNYSSLLNALQVKYLNYVHQYGIIPGKSYSANDIYVFAEKYNIRFPLFIDSLQKFTHYLQATVTPEVFLVDSSYHILYQGAIDNLLEDFGKRRIKATDNYLENAIELQLQHKTILVNKVKATGCKINDY